MADDRPVAHFSPVADTQPILPSAEQASFIAQLDASKVLQLLSNAPDPMVIVDVRGTIVFTNLQMETVFGYPPKELLGEPLNTLIPERFRVGHAGHLKRFIGMPCMRPMKQKLELWALARDGREIPVEISLYSIGEGEQRLAVANILDVTDQRNRIELENLNRQLARKTTQLESIVSDLRVFAQTASHDLQAPLRQISQFLALLERRAGDQLDGDSLEYVRAAGQSAKRLAQMVREILDYSRVGISEERFQPVNLSVLLDGVLMSMQTVIEQHQGVVTHGELETAYADAVQVKQLFQNLITNALVHRAEAEPHIHVSSRVENGRCVVSVQDNGPGIDARHQVTIFEMFRRPGVAPNRPGTGVGLAICKRIVDRHEGSLSVESEPGKGACFIFTLPHHEQR